MKAISQFLNETSKINIIDALDKISFKFSPRDLDYSYEERTSAAKEIEAEIVETIKNIFEKYKVQAEVYTSIEYAEKVLGQKWSPKFDLENGDIIIIDNGEEFYFDVKVASKAKYKKYSNDSIKKFGAINFSSLLSFAKNKHNHYYLLFTQDGSNLMIADASKLYNEFEKYPELMVSMSRDGKDTGFNATVKEWGGHKSNGIVCLQDFVSYYWLNDHYKKFQIKYV